MVSATSARFLLGSATLGALLAGGWALGCASDGQGTPPPATDAHFPRGTLTIASSTEAKDLLSPLMRSSFDINLLDLIGSKLLDVEFDCGLKFKPSYAKSWSWSADGKTLDIELRDDLKWSDGTPVSAADLVRLFDLVSDPKVGSPRASELSLLAPGAHPRVVDPTHVQFEFTEKSDPTAMVASVTSFQLVPSHLLGPEVDRASLASNPLNSTAPVSSGPWTVSAWEKGQSLTLVPNPYWVGSAPKIAKVVFKAIPEYDTRLIELQNGSVDMMEGVQVADADRLVKEHPEIKLYRRGWRNQDYIGWNNVDPKAYAAAATALEGTGKRVDVSKLPPHPLFGDPAVRRALSMAIDVDRIIGDVLTSKATGTAYARRSFGTITPELCEAGNPEIPPVPHDVEGAKKALAALGWSDTNGDGVIDKDGVPFRFTMIAPSGNPRRTAVAALVKASFQEIGVDLQMEWLANAAVGDRLRHRDFDAAFSGWSAMLWVDPSSAWGKDSEMNFISYYDPKASALLDEGLRTSDPGRTRSVWSDFQATVYADQPYTFLYWMDEIDAVNARVSDVQVDVVTPYRHLEAWSVPEDAPAR